MPHSADHSECAPVLGGAEVGRYGELFDASIADPEVFWADAARDVSWIREPRRVLDDTNPPYYRWFPDAELNTCVGEPSVVRRIGVVEDPARFADPGHVPRSIGPRTPPGRRCSHRRARRTARLRYRPLPEHVPKGLRCGAFRIPHRLSSDLGHRGPLKCIHSGGEFDGVVGPYAESEGPDPTRTSQLAESIECDKARPPPWCAGSGPPVGTYGA